MSQVTYYGVQSCRNQAILQSDDTWDWNYHNAWTTQNRVEAERVAEQCGGECRIIEVETFTLVR